MIERHDALKLLAVPNGQLGSIAKQRRIDSIREAKSWPAGASRQEQRFTRVSPVLDDYHVSLGKPGRKLGPTGGAGQIPTT